MVLDSNCLTCIENFSFTPQPRTEKNRINYTRLDDSKFFDHIDQWVRIAAAQYRCLKLRQDTYIRLGRKVSQEEKKNIDAVLQLMVLEAVLKLLYVFFKTKPTNIRFCLLTPLRKKRLRMMLLIL